LARISRGLCVDSLSGVRQHGEPVSDIYKFFQENKSVVFVNPDAGGGAGRAERNLRRVRDAFSRCEIAVEFIVAASAAEMEERVRAAVSGGARVLFAMGGDGTVQAVVNAVVNAVGVERDRENGVAIGILPSGGGNDFASALGVPKDLAEAVAVLCDATATIRSVDVLRARTGDGATRLYLGGGGVGLDVEASRHAANSYRRWPGRSRYVAAALRAWWDFEPVGVRVEFPGDELAAIETRALVAGVLNTPSYGAGLRVAPSARIDDGLLDVAIIKPLGARQIAALVPRLLATGGLPESYFVRARAHTVILQTDRPSMFHGDGEILGSAPVRIEVVPNAIRVLAPV
jgi:diacylglycerol kinase (ATP)